MSRKHTIYIVRHGETDYNLKGIVQGRGVNSSLNATGRKQAKAFFKAYGEIPFDVVYTSSLNRTHETMQAFISSGLAHVADPAIDEIDWGIYEGIEHHPEMHERYLAIIEQWRQTETSIKIDGGESADDLMERVRPFVDRIRESGHRTSLICSHGRTIRVLLCAMTGTPLHRMDDFPHGNTALYKLIFDGNSFTIDTFNNSDHLNGSL